MGICATAIKLNQGPNCDLPLVEGTDSLFYMGQIRQLTGVTYDATNPQIITGFAMASGEKLKQVSGYQLFAKPSYQSEITEFGATLPQNFEFVIYTNDAATKNEIVSYLSATDIFVIYKKAGFGREWEEMGMGEGLRLVKSGGISVAYNGDTKGAIVVKFENPNASRPPHTIRHVTAALEDTSSFLNTLALAYS